MLMAGYFNTGQKPWDRLYLHGLVRQFGSLVLGRGHAHGRVQPREEARR